MRKLRLRVIGYAVFLLAILLAVLFEYKYSSRAPFAANGSFEAVSSLQGGPSVPIALGASRLDSHSVNLHWTDLHGDSGLAGYDIYRNGQKYASHDTNSGPYFVDSRLSPLQTYTYAVDTYDSSGRHSALSKSITIRTLANGTGNKYTLSPTDDPATIYGIIENAGCGDTVTINPGTYSTANGDAAMIYIKDKRCQVSDPYVIQAANPSEPPLFDYSESMLDDQANPVPSHWAPWESDFDRGAWQIHDSSYVVIDGIHVKGARSKTDDAVAGVRYIATDHFTIRHSILEKNFDGLEGNGRNTLVEYNTFLANGYSGEDQQHQFYDMGGDELTLRYNYFNYSGCDECGQNFHSRSWHSHVYGNWFQDASDYEWDMMTPSTAYPAPSDATMTQQFYDNVIVTRSNPRNTLKVFTFYADGAGFAGGKMKLDAEWNTFWVSAAPGLLSNYNIFQISNQPGRIASIQLHFSNNIVHFTGLSSWCSSQPHLFVVMAGGPWFIDGSNNWFDSALAKPCVPAGRSDGGSCQLSNSITADNPPFRNAATMDLRPATASHPFGTADASQPLKSPNQQFPGGTANVKPRTSFEDVGALEFVR